MHGPCLKNTLGLKALLITKGSTSITAQTFGDGCLPEESAGSDYGVQVSDTEGFRG